LRVGPTGMVRALAGLESSVMANGSSSVFLPSRSYSFSYLRIMAAGANGRHAAEEEARAEVDVLNSRLEKTNQLTKKIEACLGRLEATGKSVREVVGPLNGETKKLQVLNHSTPPGPLP